MIVVRVNSQEFEQELKKLNRVHVFNVPQFAILNNLWVDEIHFLLFKTNRTILALTLGERDGKLRSPFSAPYGGFAYFKANISISSLEESLKLLQDYARMCNCTQISITCPPTFYAHSFLTKLSFCYNKLADKSVCDINYHFDLLDKNFEKKVDGEFRRDLKKGIKNKLTLIRCEKFEEKQLCYNIIDENHTRLGYPVRMGFDPLLKTAKIIVVDFLLLQNTKESYAGAIVYWITKDIVQAILWGDDTNKRGEGSMHSLSVHLRKYYQQRGVGILDLGPSSVDGIPNIGLCKFKESLGCDVSLKNSYTFYLNAY